MKKILLLVLLLLPLGAAGADDWKPLQDRADPLLQARLEARLKENP
jgi:hypothetical protein